MAEIYQFTPRNPERLKVLFDDIGLFCKSGMDMLRSTVRAVRDDLRQTAGSDFVANYLDTNHDALEATKIHGRVHVCLKDEVRFAGLPGQPAGLMMDASRRLAAESGAMVDLLMAHFHASAVSEIALDVFDAAPNANRRAPKLTLSEKQTLLRSIGAIKLANLLNVPA